MPEILRPPVDLRYHLWLFATSDYCWLGGLRPIAGAIHGLFVSYRVSACIMYIFPNQFYVLNHDVESFVSACIPECYVTEQVHRMSQWFQAFAHVLSIATLLLMSRPVIA